MTAAWTWTSATCELLLDLLQDLLLLLLLQDLLLDLLQDLLQQRLRENMHWNWMHCRLLGTDWISHVHRVSVCVNAYMHTQCFPQGSGRPWWAGLLTL